MLLSSRHLWNQYRQNPFCDFDFNKNGGYRESWETMGQLGHDHGVLVIGRVEPLCGRAGPCNDNLFYP